LKLVADGLLCLGVEVESSSPSCQKESHSPQLKKKTCFPER
jgi:hypothetical protein